MAANAIGLRLARALHGHVAHDFEAAIEEGATEVRWARRFWRAARALGRNRAQRNELNGTVTFASACILARVATRFRRRRRALKIRLRAPALENRATSTVRILADLLKRPKSAVESERRAQSHQACRH